MGQYTNTFGKYFRYIPGHLHAFYIIYVYYSRQEGNNAAGYERAPGIYSERVQTGGRRLHPAAAPPQGQPQAPAGQGYGTL